MAYIKLKSDNPDFSRVIQKNPATQEAAKKKKKKNTKTARTYLWFENPQEVFLLLKNFDNKRGKGFEYLDYDSFSGGQVHLQLQFNSNLIPILIGVKLKIDWKFKFFLLHLIFYLILMWYCEPIVFGFLKRNRVVNK